MDAGREDLLDVLVTLRVASAGDIGVGQLVDQDHGRPAGQHGVQVHLLDLDTPVGGMAPGHDLQALGQGLRLGPAVGLDIADDDVNPVGGQAMPVLSSIW